MGTLAWRVIYLVTVTVAVCVPDAACLVRQSLMAVQAAKHYGISAKFAKPLELADNEDFVVQYVSAGCRVRVTVGLSWGYLCLHVSLCCKCLCL